ncbi:ATP-dependent helicase, partial [bacterium]|nr:ATP-dependent helicase [bacterium]
SKSEDGIASDAEEDLAAWDSCLREIRSERGGEPDLQELVQGMSLRSKEPPKDPNSVVLMTVHAAKGLEFDFVYVIGLAESIMPSWQSIQKGSTSPEMEEERRNCFVAITRTREHLTLSWAEKYGSWKKQPSRFLKEMGFIS